MSRLSAGVAFDLFVWVGFGLDFVEVVSGSWEQSSRLGLQVVLKGLCGGAKASLSLSIALVWVGRALSWSIL